MTLSDLQKLLTSDSDFDLCDGVFSCISDAELQSEEAHVVMFVWSVSGILDNGGFEYLFSRGLSDDEDYTQTISAFETIGAAQAATAFRRALHGSGAKHPNNEQYSFDRLTEQQRLSINQQCWGGSRHVPALLAGYIRVHRQRLFDLLSTSCT